LKSIDAVFEKLIVCELVINQGTKFNFEDFRVLDLLDIELLGSQQLLVHLAQLLLELRVFGASRVVGPRISIRIHSGN
jgi:hypothetical protein